MTGSKRQQGFALLLVLMVILVAGTLGVSYLSSASVKLASSANMANAARAKYLSESGLEHAMFLLRMDPNVLANSFTTPLGPYQVDTSGDTYIFWAVGAGQPRLYTLSAQATVEGITQNTSVTVEIRSAYRDLVMWHGPRHYWRLGEGSGWLASDETNRSIGIYRNGVDLGRPGAIMGTDDTAAKFDGIDEYVDVGDMDVQGNQLTIIAWVCRSADVLGSTEGRLVSKNSGSTDYWTLGTCENVNKRFLAFNLRVDGSTMSLRAGEGEIVPGRWHMASAVYDGEVMRLYLDGVEVATRAKVGVAISQNSWAPVWIGNEPPYSTNKPWSGDIDEVAIFESALTAQQLVELYRARNPVIDVVQWHD